MNKENRQKNEQSLKTLRKRAGFTQENLARKIDLTKSMIGYYETGNRKPSLDNFIRLAIALEANLKDLAEAFGYDCSQIPDLPYRLRSDSTKK